MSATTVLLGLLVFNILVIAHELGHFLVARRAGIAVPEFSVGFGPRLLRFRRGATAYTWRLLPLGGYVLLPDLAPEEGVPTTPLRRRALVLLAGPVVSMALAVLLMGPMQTVLWTGAWFQAMADLVRGSQDAQLTGLVGISQAVGQAAAYGWRPLANLTGFLSLNFALLNLLPVPGFDGARLVGLLIEKLNGGRRPRWGAAVQGIGLLFVLGLGLWVTGHEILRAIRS
jgi:membrane-associated protease RseP (regulator of RpoE activity)